MRIYITGAVASGKSTLAEKLAKVTGVPCTHLDDVRYKKDPASFSGNIKRSRAEYEPIFEAIIAREHFILEDTARPHFVKGMVLADQVVLLEPPLFVRFFRVIKRWIKQNLGMEKCSYRPGFYMLKNMLRWTRGYDTGEDDVQGRIAPFMDKVIVLRNGRQIRDWLKQFKKRENDEQTISCLGAKKTGLEEAQI